MTGRNAMLSRLRRYEDPAASSDPAIRDLVAELRTVALAPPPRAEFRHELRTMLVAVTPRLVAEGDATTVAPRRHPFVDAQRALGAHLRAALGHAQVRRPLTALAAVAAVFGLLLGGAVWVSSTALPGDTLYGLKRVNESFELSLASGDTDRAKAYLSQAKERAAEAAALVGRANSGKLVASTLDAADEATRSASQLLTTAAVNDTSDAPLKVALNWVPAQLAQLDAVAAKAPTAETRQRAVASRELVARVQERAVDLQAQLGCDCLSATGTDDLGPLPCTGPCTPVVKTPVSSMPQLPQGPAVGEPRTGSAGAPTAAPHTQHAPTGAAVQAPVPGATDTPAATLPVGTSIPPLLPPNLPPTTPLVDSCGVNLSPLPITLSTCR